MTIYSLASFELLSQFWKSVVPCKVQSVAVWPIHRFFRRQVRCSGILISKNFPQLAQLVKNLPAVWETWVQSLGWEKGKATHSSILAWRIPWTLQSMDSQSQTRLNDFHSWDPPSKALELSEEEVDFFNSFFNSLVLCMIQLMLAIWSLVPLVFLNPDCTSGSSQFTYCWRLPWRILSIILIPCEMSTIVQ